MNMIMNEREFALEALQNKALGRAPLKTLYIVAKYLYSQGYRRKAIEQKLSEFVLLADPNIYSLSIQDSIVNMAKQAGKYSLIEIESIPITKKEIDVCDKLPTPQLRRLMFTLIFLAKFSNVVNHDNNDWVNREHKEIFSLANIITTNKRQAYLLHELYTRKLIKFSKRVDNLNVCVTCLDDTDETFINITDPRNIGFQYEQLKNSSSFVKCKECGKIIRKASNRQMYCKDCAVLVNISKTSERQNVRKYDNQRTTLPQ